MITQNRRGYSGGSYSEIWGNPQLRPARTYSLSLTVSGYVHSRAQQGIYDLPSAGSLDVNPRWQLLRKKATLRLWCDDIFQTSGISPEVNYGGQRSINHYPCWRELGVSLTWRIGDYKERRREEVDTSRFR